MRALRAALQPCNGEFSSVDISKALGELTLSDLRSYISHSALRLGVKDCRFSAADHVIRLDNVLKLGGPLRWFCRPSDILGCSTLYHSKDAVLCWFVVPPGGMLPLHDHPAMRVWQRVLFGRLHVTSIDWLNGTAPTDESDHTPCRWDGIVVGSGAVAAQVNAPDCTSLVKSFGPRDGGVLHEIVNDSAEPALFIDAITPPYVTPPHNIKCTYYSVTRNGGSDTVSLGPQGCEGLEVGQHVRLVPRTDYGGPPMEPFLPVEPLW
ncbi:cysteamine dioxygenase [Trypanosoma grayi]|uniref:cysteamine dioxygenase n=1 Tax=Trypanosoma grayi TaxID=71804 RepID=UPI0004F4324A|nr:cysteamine dioxygenase [Trypanosoma grayi]KEG13965.1 cysteamine dioxygenase [Trypanosoma grayi]